MDPSRKTRESPGKTVVSLKKQPMSASKDGTVGPSGMKGKLSCSSDSPEDHDPQEDNLGNHSTKTLVASNLSALTQPRHVVAFFPHSRVVDYHFIHDKRSGKFSGRCYVEFETVEAALMALGSNGEILLDRKVHLEFSSNNIKSMHRQPVLSSVVAVSNFKIEKTKEKEFQTHLEQLFEHCGAIKKVDIDDDGTKGKLGLAFVHFEDSSSVEAALSVHTRWIKGRKMIVARTEIL